MLLDADGHIMLADFGLSKTHVTSTSGRSLGHRATTFCGTAEYLAPEVVVTAGHGKAVDWWSLGIVLFEMLAGARPFAVARKHKRRDLRFFETLCGRITMPEHFSPHAADLVRQLLTLNPEDRPGPAAVKHHPWFAAHHISWAKLYRRAAGPPFIPRLDVTAPKPAGAPADVVAGLVASLTSFGRGRSTSDPHSRHPSESQGSAGSSPALSAGPWVNFLFNEEGWEEIPVYHGESDHDAILRHDHAVRPPARRGSAA